MQFYLIRDRDYLTDALAAHYTQQGRGRLYVLQRCHIENYLLDEELLSRTLGEIFNIKISPTTVQRDLREACVGMAGDVLRDMVAFRLNAVFQAEDFSLGKILQGERFVDDSGKWRPEKVELFMTLLQAKVNEVSLALSTRVETAALNALVRQCCAEIEGALVSASEDWKIKFPGKRLIADYGKKVGVGRPVALVNSLIKELATTPSKIPAELVKLIEKISVGAVLPL